MNDEPGAGSSTLQVRSTSDGRVVRDLLTGSLDIYPPSVSRDNAGSVLIGQRTSICTTVISRVDARNGKISPVRTIDAYASNIVFDPTGRRLAYQTYASCAVARGEQTCGGCAHFFPNVTTVLDLTTGVTTHVSEPLGLGAGIVSFSPDGSQLLVESGGLVRLDPTNITAPGNRVSAPRGCTYAGGLWSDAGIVTDEQCGSHNRLALVTPAGAIQRTWPLPRCGGISRLAAGPSGSIMATVSIGYANDSCAAESYQLWQINGAETRVIASGKGVDKPSWELAGP